MEEKYMKMLKENLENIKTKMSSEYETPPLDFYWLMTNGIKSLFLQGSQSEQRLIQIL